MNGRVHGETEGTFAGSRRNQEKRDHYRCLGWDRQNLTCCPLGGQQALPFRSRWNRILFRLVFYAQGTQIEQGNNPRSSLSSELFLDEALEFFGDSAEPKTTDTSRKKGERLAGLICRRRALLVLDGLEPLQDARSGQILDDGIKYLLRGLAAHNKGLCLVTTRPNMSGIALPDLSVWHELTTIEYKLPNLTEAAGAALLAKLGVNGSILEKHSICQKVKGHALTLTLLGN
jgi:hypothetical protein